MADDAGLDGRDEPARGPDDHAELLSALDSHDLAVATDPVAPDDDGFDFALGASEPADTVFPQSVASGGPTPEGVILWTRIAPDAFDADEPLGCRSHTTRRSPTSVTRGS
ncbi:hypothetical protein [Salinigranum rubrum]|uniref:hypothetical protein n=1 Tax=Salinigranum rubrum TaxID=755307 RepID=UPI001FE3DED3|nr:hypothetical protein [Salinigranum rubrum]